eukprot:698137-Rhodomonas_salina.2
MAWRERRDIAPSRLISTGQSVRCSQEHTPLTVGQYLSRHSEHTHITHHTRSGPVRRSVFVGAYPVALPGQLLAPRSACWPRPQARSVPQKTLVPKPQHVKLLPEIDQYHTKHWYCRRSILIVRSYRTPGSQIPGSSLTGSLAAGASLPARSLAMSVSCIVEGRCRRSGRSFPVEALLEATCAGYTQMSGLAKE